MIDEVEHQNIGNLLDPELEQELIECQAEEEFIHPDFVQVNPDNFDIQNNMDQIKKTFRAIEIRTEEEDLHQARTLDEFQKKVLHVLFQFWSRISVTQ